MLGVITRAATQRYPHPFRMREVPVAALAAPVGKTGSCQIGNQLAQLTRHFSIKTVSLADKPVNPVRRVSRFSRSGALDIQAPVCQDFLVELK